MDLEGFRISEKRERLIASLFADDTAIFFSENNDLEALQKLLEIWCTVSTAKFNITKMEIIPIGTKTLKERTQESQKVKADQNPIPENIHIVREGEVVKILGAWYGYNFKVTAPWNTVLGKIMRNLKQCEKSHPSLERRRLIVQMIVGGMTQYLTQIQGMPKEIKKKLSKIV